MTDFWMDVDTALAEVPVNIMPLVDDTDFKSIEDAVVYNAAGMALIWHFVTTAGAMTETAVTPTTAGLHDWTDQGTSGCYALEIPASGGTINNDAEGYGWFTGVADGILPWRGPTIGFRSVSINNALIDGGDVLDVSVIELAGVTQSLTDLKDFADTGYDPATNKVQGVLLTDTLTTYTGNTPQTGDVFPKFSGMTILANWLRAFVRKDTSDTTALTEINSGGGAYDEAVDSQESIADSIAAAAPLEFNPDASSTIVTGTLISGTFADTATNNSVHWVVDDAGAGIEVITEMNLGSGRHATSFLVNGKFTSGASRIVEFWAFNYTTAAYVKFSAGTALTEMRNSGSDSDYGDFSLPIAFTNPVSIIGEVKIKFLSAQSNSGDRLSIDLVAVTGEASGATSPAAIADAVANSDWGVSMNHIPKFAGHVWYVNGVTGNDANSGLYPDQALATISGAVSGATAGDFIKVFATTYLEAVTLNLDGLELHGEIGATITGAAGVPLTVTADSCIIDNVLLTPAAGQKGLVISGDNNRTLITDINGGLVSVEVSGVGNTFSDTNATDYTQTAFDIQNAGSILHICTAKTVNTGTRAFYLSNTLADRTILGTCESVNNTLAAFEIVAGVTNASLFNCAESETCGDRVDNGTSTSWRQHSVNDEFLDIQADLNNGTDGLGAIKSAVDTRMAESSINTTAGAIDNVTTVATTTTSTDMRGTDSAALASALTTAQNDLDIITGSTGALLDPTATSAQLVDDVWDEVISMADHNIGQSSAKILRQSGDLVQIDGAVSDASPSKTDFDTNLTQVDGYFDDSVLIFSNGSANAGIGRPVSVYLNASGNMTFPAPDEWPVTPVNGDDFVIFAAHVHPIAQLQSGLATEAKQDIIDANVDLVLEDTADMQPIVGSGSPFANAVKGNVVGTVGSGSTTTSIVSSSITPSGTDADQFKGKIMTFTDDTTTAALRGQSTDITANTAASAPTFTVTALTTSAISGDEFTLT